MNGGRAAYLAAIVFAISLARFGFVPLLRLPADSATLAMLDAALPALAHLVLFPVVNALPAPGWARAAGYGWLVVDVCTDVLALNGVAGTIYLPLRYGGHVSAALWIAVASWHAPRAPRWVGALLALDLGLYSFVAPWASFVWLVPSSFMLIAWLVLVGRLCGRRGAAVADAVGCSGA